MGSQSCSICLYCGFFPIIGCEVCSECLPAILCFRHGPDTLGRRLVWIRRGGGIQRWEQTYQKALFIPRTSTWGLLQIFEKEVQVGQTLLAGGQPCQPRSSSRRRTGKAASGNTAGPCFGDSPPSHRELQDAFPSCPEP